MDILVLLLLAQDWSDFVTERPLSPVESDALRDRVSKWVEQLPDGELVELGRRARLTRAQQRPLYHVRARSLEEHRDLRTVRKPYAGAEPLRRATGDVDPWGPPTPDLAVFMDREWRLPIEGSAETRDCVRCGGAGKAACGDCRSEKQVDCSRCRKSGKVNCASCNGTQRKSCSSCGGSGKTRCSSCGGSGRRRSSGETRDCSSCSGGKRSCSSCSGGKVSCRSCSGGKVKCGGCAGAGRVTCSRCRGVGTFRCDPCEGHGRIVESLEIVIQLRVRETTAVVSALDEEHRALLREPSVTRVIEASRLAETLAMVPDALLRERILETARRSAEAPVGKPRAREVRVQRVPCIDASLEFDELPYRLLVAEDRLILPASPERHWARLKAERARHLLTAGDRNGAVALSARALKADPANVEAAAILATARRQQAEESARSASIRGWLTVAGVTLAVMILVKIWAVWMRRRLARRISAR